MITVGVIRNGERYLSHHLRKNDYWTEGEKEVIGEWIGEGAKALALTGEVESKAFDALRSNRHPHTKQKLTPGDSRKRMALFDIQISAPKDVSVLAMVGSDERVRAAFYDAVKVTLTEMEQFAAVRERRGEARTSEAFRLTKNFVGALFLHDTSRDLDPQLHVHAVLANATWDAEREQWLALQHAEMMRASGYVRQVFYRELATRLRQLGYDTYDMNSKGFSVRGVEHLRERYSKRSRHVQKLADDFTAKKGRRPSKREIEVLVRGSRGDKLTEVSTPEVRARQREQLTREEQRNLDELVKDAAKQSPQTKLSVGQVPNVLDSALRHVYERDSVAREVSVLSAALELHPNFDNWRGLRAALEAHPAAIRSEGEMTLHPITMEEAQTARRVREGRATRFPLGDPAKLPERLTQGQRAAATSLLRNIDFLSILVGDAGTGKTTVLTAIEAAHRAAGGQPFMPLAPTTRAREALVSSGFENADTVQRFLVIEELHTQAASRVLLVDEAGLLSTQQLHELTRIAHKVRARVLLVGDTKQHYSVERGDALRNVIRHTELPVVRLSEVLRQRSDTDRRFSRMLASGDVLEAFYFAERKGMIVEAGDDEALFSRAAEHYATNTAQGIDTLVVIPFWEEIEQFNVHARRTLRRAGLLGEAEIVRQAVKPLAWSEEQKTHWDQYHLGDRLLFVRNTRFMKRGTAAEVTAILPDGLQVRDAKGRFAKITRKQRGTYDVGRVQSLPVATGDRLLMRGPEDSQEFANGDIQEVTHVDPERNEIVLGDGKILPADFHAWTYAHALTSYRAQGSTAEETIFVLGEVAERALARRQFYVGNTRFRGMHRIYVSHREAILERLARPDPGRELATEFLSRHRLTHAELISCRRLPRVREWLRVAIRNMTEYWRRAREAMTQKQEI